MKKRFILDMTMLFVFLIVVGYKPLGNYWHETLGMVLFWCFCTITGTGSGTSL